MGLGSDVRDKLTEFILQEDLLESVMLRELDDLEECAGFSKTSAKVSRAPRKSVLKGTPPPPPPSLQVAVADVSCTQVVARACDVFYVTLTHYIMT